MADPPAGRSGDAAGSAGLPLAGVRVVEVASHVFVPMAGAVLAEWGAEVVKVEHPAGGDPYRGLVTVGLHNVYRGVDPFFQSANRAKRSVGVDLSHAAGRALLGRLVATADVFMTNLRDGARRRLGIELADVRADNPAVVYVRGTALGRQGPDAGGGGYDAGAFWARTGMAHLMRADEDAWPSAPRPAFGDVVGALSIAAAVNAALYRRATTGVPTEIDASLLAAGIWQVQADVVNAGLDEEPPARRRPDRRQLRNPLMSTYRTADGRFVALTMVAPDPHWADLCRRLGRPGLAGDPRFVDADVRGANAAACVDALDDLFAAQPLEEWRRRLDGFAGEWAVVQTPAEVHHDPQVVANGYVARVDIGGDATLPMVTAPAQFDGAPGRPTRAPEVGEHTETLMVELGLGWDEIGALKDAGTIT